MNSLECHAESLDLPPTTEAVLPANPQHGPGGLTGVTAQFSESYSVTHGSVRPGQRFCSARELVGCPVRV